MAGMLSCTLNYRSENMDALQTRLTSKSVNVSVSNCNLCERETKEAQVVCNLKISHDPALTRFYPTKTEEIIYTYYMFTDHIFTFSFFYLAFFNI